MKSWLVNCVALALVGLTVELSATASASCAVAKETGYKVYDHAVGEYQFRMVVPEGLAVVRGILVVGPCLGGDSRDFCKQPWYGEFMNLHGFAFLGAKDYFMTDYKVLQAVLQQFATDSKHPELVHPPFPAAGERGSRQGHRRGHRLFHSQVDPLHSRGCPSDRPRVRHHR